MNIYKNSIFWALVGIWMAGRCAGAFQSGWPRYAYAAVCGGALAAITMKMVWKR